MMYHKLVRVDKVKKVLSDFENHKFDPWVCPIIRCHCDPKCYSFIKLRFGLWLKKSKSMHDKGTWQMFHTVDGMNKYLAANEDRIHEISGAMLYEPCCNLLDSIADIAENLRCHNV